MKNWSEYTVWQKVKIILLIFISVLFIIFASQNWEKVRIEFIGWKFSVNLFSALLFSFFLGLVVSLIISRVKIKTLKKVIHLRNDEIKRLKFDSPNKEDIIGITEKVDQIIESNELKNDLHKEPREKK